MEVEFFDSLEEAQARLRQAMEAADARVKPWQAAVKVGDCFIADGGEEARVGHRGSTAAIFVGKSLAASSDGQVPIE